MVEYSILLRATKAILFLMLSLFFGCWSHQSESVSGKPLEVKTFNLEVSDAYKSGKDWTLCCYEVALRFAGNDRLARRRFVQVSEALKQSNEVTVVVTQEDIDDDSIDGVRHRLRLRRVKEGYWIVALAERSWKCKSGRGHDTYSGKLCN